MAIRSLKTGSFSRSTQVGNTMIFPGSYESIATVVVPSGGSSSIAFTSIPSTYQHLQIRGIARSTTGTSGVNIMYFRFNSDSASNYSAHNVYGNGSSAAALQTTGQTYGWMGRTSTPRTGNGASIFSGFVIDVLDYTSTNKNKTVKTITGSNNNSTTDAVELCSSLWFATPAAVNRIDLYDESGNFAEYSHFALYGVK